jgi:catechol 2,3-dioxygenase-like lactoylglutathione lyase family enzyme
VSVVKGLRGIEHIGLTVPDIEAATRFFVDVLGAESVYDEGPFAADNDWMTDNLGVEARAAIPKLRILKIANGPSLELFEYDAPDQATRPPRNSDIGGHHLASTGATSWHRGVCSLSWCPRPMASRDIWPTRPGSGSRLEALQSG